MLSVGGLRVLRELQRLGTIAAVAEALSYTPSAISQRLSQLEREAGVPLLERVGRGVRLTAEADRLVEHADAVLARLELAESELAAAHPAIHGVLRVASFPSVVLSLIPRALTALAERHPGLVVEVTQREAEPAYDGLLAHQFDVILGEEYPGFPDPIVAGVDRVDLLRDALRVAHPATGPFAGATRIADLAAAPWALDPPDSAIGRWALAVCREAGFEPVVRFESPDPLLHAHLVRSGHAVAFLAELIAARELGGARLIRLPGSPHRTLYTAVRTGRLRHPAIVAFREALREAAREEQAEGEREEPAR